jgi:hypothetical protein
MPFLEELHTTLEAPMKDALGAPPSTNRLHTTFGEFAREAIFYGAQSAFRSQYTRLARRRYKADWEWLLKRVRISIGSMIQIADIVSHHFDAQMTAVVEEAESRAEIVDAASITNALIFSKQMLTNRFGEKAQAFLTLFSTPIYETNKGFLSPFDFNEVNPRPLIDMGQHIYSTGEYNLAQSIYESPYYWMLKDPAYCDAAAEHRGKFLEAEIAYRAKQIFGEENVFTNVTISGGKGVTLAEADVLVIYGEFVLVFKAKSKRLTLQARSGEARKIEADFGDAVQSAYEQAVLFGELLAQGAECNVGSGKARRFAFVIRTFPIVVLSDHFPSLTILMDQLLKAGDRPRPVVVDLFFLEVCFELLGDPVEVLYYLQQRARFFDKLRSDSEFNLLGFHLKTKLFVEDEYDGVLIWNDFASDIEDYWIAKELGRQTKPFLKLEDRTGVPKAASLISFLKSGPPEVAGAAIDLLDFSTRALRDFTERIDHVRARVSAGRAFSAFSVRTHFGGLSYVAVSSMKPEAKAMAATIGRRHKYKQQQDRWFILLDLVGSKRPLDGVLPLWDKWEQSKEMDEAIEELDRLVPTREEKANPDDIEDS